MSNELWFPRPSIPRKGWPSPYLNGYYYCQTNGWIPQEIADESPKGIKRCPFCSGRLRSRPHNKRKNINADETA